MSTNTYRFETRWRIRATITEIATVFSDPTDLPRWWPAVYLTVRECDPGEPNGIGKRFDLHTKGWLPYTLRWQLQVVAIEAERLEVAGHGDLVGKGVWSFAQDGAFTVCSYIWEVRADKSLLRWLSWVFKPIFAANHHWAMRMGQISLERELARRRVTPEVAAHLPPPPEPTSNLGFALAGLGLLALLALLLRRRQG
jgi:LPXTG-motif cell wall-anchored protein